MLQFGVLMKSLMCADMSRFDTWPASTPTPHPPPHSLKFIVTMFRTVNCALKARLTPTPLPKEFIVQVF